MKAAPAPAKRILSVDVLRGLTVACMILVNNGYGESFAQLRHSAWNGLTLCDLVFPFFLFIMGVSVNFSRKGSAGTILRRAVLILLLGWAVYYVEYALKGDFLPFDHFRLTGVLPRIALCYGCAALLSRYLPRAVPWVAGGLLAAYALVLLLGRGYVAGTDNVLCIVDRSLLGEAHLYRKSPVDPEGLLSTVPAIAHTLLGCLCGRMVKSDAPLGARLRRIGLYGLLLAAAGLLLAFWLPLNKRVWSPSYALLTSGLCALLLAGLTWLIDARGCSRWSAPFVAFGRNALAVYVFSELFSVVARQSGLSDGLYTGIGAVCPAAPWASLLYALFFVIINFLLALLLYKKKIFIKL